MISFGVYFILKSVEYLGMKSYCFDMYSAPGWKVPTSFIYGETDWMDYKGAVEARKRMNVPCEIFRVPQVRVLFFEIRFRIM